MMNPDLLRSVRLSSSSPGGIFGRIRSNRLVAALFAKMDTVKFPLRVAAVATVAAIFFFGMWGGVSSSSTSSFSLSRYGSHRFSFRRSPSTTIAFGVQRDEPCLMSNPCKFKIVADLDTLSKMDTDGKMQFKSYLLSGWLWKNEASSSYSLEWLGSPSILTGTVNEGGRGMELSELVRYNGKLLTFDDRTGIVYEVLKDGTGAPRHILTDGDGNCSKGMKMEWATVKDDLLYIGSVGKEFTSQDGKQILNGNPFWVASIDPQGHIVRHNWEVPYTTLRRALGAEFPGYLIHEAVTWNPRLRKWLFLPRRVSSLPYDDVADESRGSNKVLVVSEDFSKVDVHEIGTVNPRRGFSSAKIVPGTDGQVLVALKSEENASAETQRSFVTIFDLNGHILLDDLEVPNKFKFEGIEFED